MAVATAVAQDNPALNMTLYDHLNPVTGQGPHSALWGYTAPDGREYALFGSQIGTHIIDITEKPIREVAFIGGPKTSWREMKVYKQYAYVVNDNTGVGIQIVDLSKLPDTATVVNEDTEYFHTAHTVYIRDHYMYINGTKAEAGINGGVMIFDLEPDPVHPRRVGQISPYYYHDSFVRNDTLLGAAIYGQGCDIWDIRDKANPVHLANINYPFSGTHNAELTPDGGFVATTDEIGSTAKTLKIWDIHDLNNITKAAEFTPNLMDIVHNVHFLGRYALVAWYTAGIRILDMIDPRHPREVGYYDTYPGQSGSYDGVWEVFGAFPSGKIIAGDRQTGLYVLNFNNTIGGSISGIVRNATTHEPIPNVTIRLDGGKSTITSDASGRYYIGGASGQQIALATSQFGYGATSETITLNGDQQRDLDLTPLQFFNATIIARDAEGHQISDFAYAIEPYIHSQKVGTTASLSLPRDSAFVVTVGKWGYAIARPVVRITQDAQEVTVTLTRRYQDDATLDLGWNTLAPDDSATSGEWARLTPYIPFAGGGWFFPQTEPFDGGGPVFMTGAPPFNVPLDNADINGGSTTLTSPPMDLTGYPNPRINFHLWSVYIPRDSVHDDSLLVQLTNDGGAHWVTALTVGSDQGGWMEESIYPKELLTLTGQMGFRLRASDYRSNDLVFAAMDNFDVTSDGAAGVSGDDAAATGVAMTVAPNPIASAGGTITVTAPAHLGAARLELFDPLGRSVALLHDGPLDAGETRLRIGAALPSGAYILRLTAPGLARYVGVRVVR
jgi:choice-of-anchor B domain-containing protein